MAPAQQAFDTLKSILTSPPVLAHPNYSIPFELATDASSCGLGAMLSQKGRPIAYAARTLNTAERNYPIIERECLAVIWALNKFRVYFGPQPVKVITDHSALTKLTNGKNLSSRMIRWTLKLAEFNVLIEHRSGKENVVADTLSRCMKESETQKEDTIKCYTLPSVMLSSKEELIREQRNDQQFGKIYKYLEDPYSVANMEDTFIVNWSQDFKLIDGLLFYSKFLTSKGELKVVIPENLQQAILYEFHDNALAGHLGYRKTFSKLNDSCYFPHMRNIVQKYVSSCELCQKYNYKNVRPAGKLLPIKVTFPLEIVGIDLIGPYPLSNPERYRYVLVITDYFSKWVEFVPLRKASAQAVATAFFNNFISKYGAPLQIVSDHGKQFVGEIFETLCRKLEIKHVCTVPYRPQSNQAERVNRTLIQMIATYVDKYHDTWDQYLQHFAFALRTTVHDTTGKTPAELFLGRKILTPFQRLILVPDRHKDFVCGDLEKFIQEARIKLGKAQKDQEKYYNMRRRIIDIKVGDQVLLETHYLSSKAQKKVAKFGPKFVGPYQVLKVIENNLVINVNGKHMTVNLDQVRVYKKRDSDSLSSNSSREFPGLSLNPPSNTFQSDENNSEYSNKPFTTGNRSKTLSSSEQDIVQSSAKPVKQSEKNKSAPPLQVKRKAHSDFSDPVLRQKQHIDERQPAEKRSVSTRTKTSQPPHRKPRKAEFRSSPAKRTLSEATSSSRGHIEKFQAAPSTGYQSQYRQRLRPRQQSFSQNRDFRHQQQSAMAFSHPPFKSKDERDFIKCFWNSNKQLSESLKAMESSL